MHRVIALAAIGLVLVSCDPIYKVSASKRIPASLDPTCVVETLLMEKTVRSADALEGGRVRTQLIIPEDLKGPSGPYAVVEQRRTDRGEQEIDFSINFVPIRESPEYEAYVQKVLEDLRDRTIEKCGAK